MYLLRIALIGDIFHTVSNMNDSLVFQNALADALEKRRDWLDRKEMNRLKEEFRILQASFTGLNQVLLKKGITHEDPYKNDVKMGDIQIPPEGPFSESEKIDQISIRLSNYENQLDFLVNFYQFSVDFLSMDRIKKIVALTKYFNWVQFTPNSQYINTRALAEIINMLKSGNDQLSSGLVADSIIHLEKSSKNIFKILKTVADYHRENYKLELRMRFLDEMSFDAATVISHKDASLLRIKRKFAEAMSDRPFYPELVEEVLKEDYSGEGQLLKDDLLKRLAIEEEKPDTQKQEESYKTVLLEGMRMLGTLSYTLEDILRKTDENSAIMEAGKNSFWDKVRRIVRQMLNKEDEALNYELEFLDTISGVSRRETVDYTQFRIEVERKARFLASIGNKTSSTVKKLNAADEDQLLSLLSRNLEELQSMHKTLTAFDEYFKSETDREDRNRIRGIKPELGGVKNAIVKANQKRHEYIAQKEEQEQMKRLGIKDEA